MMRGDYLLRRSVAWWRALRFILHLLYGLILALSYPRLNKVFRQRVLRRWSAELLAILAVRIQCDTPLGQVAQGLIVSNHISWLDVFVLNALVPMRFVAKSEVRAWPVFGWLCARAQTLFIERGNARAAARMNVQMAALLRDGECLAVFPEGTTTDGAELAHFHASLLQPAIDADVPLHPFALRYETAEGQRSMVAAYIDELSFGASLWQILSCRELCVRVHATPVIVEQGSERRALAQTAQHAIAQALQQMEAVAVVTKLSYPCHGDAISLA
ncbi:MAG: lysophospholipid acyltransferase family protein [Gallionella sp.]